MSAEPVVTCPNCGNEVKLTESLAAPLLAATRQQYEQKLAKQSADFAARESAVKAREAELARAREAINADRESLDAKVQEGIKAERAKLAADAQKRDAQLKEREAAIERQKEAADALVAEKLQAERAKLVAEEARKAKLALGADLDAKTKALAELEGILESKEEKLAEARKAQAELVRKERELVDARREMELTIETRVTESLGKAREQAKKDAEQELSLKLQEKQLQIESMQTKIEELKKKAEQGSQQLQGEALEIQLESILSQKFPLDVFEPVPKGEHGGDIIQRVVSPTGSRCGTILWESKRTKNWSAGWLPKLRDDQRAAKAELAIIASAILPEGVDSFDHIDGVWIVHPKCVVPVAMSLRHMLMEVSTARTASEGQQTKMELVYHYLTGPKFKLRVSAIVEAFDEMQNDLIAERKAIQKQWKKRETQIERMMEATVGMYGELQGIAGKSLGEIEGLAIERTGDRGLLPVEH